MAQRGKRYLELVKLIDHEKKYTVDEAVHLLKETAKANFDQTIEIHFRLGIDSRHADQQVRASATLPSGSGKNVRILVFAQGDGERAAREAGADYAGSDDLIKQIEGGWLDFDVALATPDMMGKVGRLGRVLGRRGLMPNPRSGTIATPEDLPRVINERRGGRVDFRNDRTNLVHIPIGKASVSEEQIKANLLSAIDAVNRARPTGAKGTYIRSIATATSMGPGIRLDVNTAVAASEGVAA
jgi:large subunit ribosomal protein L1